MKVVLVLLQDADQNVHLAEKLDTTVLDRDSSLASTIV